MYFCINGDELRKALKDIGAAEKNGFMFCLAVFNIATAGESLSECTLRYSDMIERAHPTNGQLNWGRFQSVSRNNKFKDGKLVPVRKKK